LYGSTTTTSTISTSYGLAPITCCCHHHHW
jgi:hypothetical protein